VAFPRFARQDVMVGDKQVHKGDVVLVSIPGVNRDTAFGEGPEAFIPERESSRSHLAFGHGLHRCVGAELARMELRIAFPALSQRFPDMQLAIEDPADHGFRESSIVYGVESVPVRPGREARGGVSAAGVALTRP
ncbi:MAG TPA: cytochrome P450, partial [Nocardioides sp.]